MQQSHTEMEKAASPEETKLKERLGSMRKITYLQICELPSKYDNKALYFTFRRNKAKPFKSRRILASEGKATWESEFVPDYPLFDSYTQAVRVRICQRRWFVLERVVVDFREKPEHLLSADSFTDRRPVKGIIPHEVELRLASDDVGDEIAIGDAAVRGTAMGGARHLQRLDALGTAAHEQGEKVADVGGLASEFAEDSGVNLDDILSSVLSNLGVVWEKLADVSELHPYLNTAYKAVDFLYKQYKDQLARDEKVRALADTLKDIYEFLEHAEQLNDPEHFKQDRARKKILRDITAQTRECIYFIIEYAQTPNFMARLVSLKKTQADSKLKEFSSTFDGLKEEFMKSAKLSTVINLANIQRDVRNASRQWKFKWVRDADYDKERCCHPSTAQYTLGIIANWINARDDSRVLLLVGPSGVGKTTIAHTIATISDSEHTLGASFFFDRAAQTRSNPKVVFPTIGAQLAAFNQGIQRAMMKTNDALGSEMDLSEQFTTFLAVPSKAYSGRTPVVIVLDAIDQCGTDEEREKLLDVISTRASELPSNYRILLTARPVPEIISDYEKAQIPVIRLERGKSNSDDIRKYLVAELAAFPGIGEETAASLAEKSGGCWWWTSACRGYITSNQAFRGGRIPVKRAESLLQGTEHSKVYLERKHVCVIGNSPCNTV